MMMAGDVAKTWDGVVVQKWLESRVVAARAGQAAAERNGRSHQDDCDKATAEEMVCSLLKRDKTTSGPEAFLEELRVLLDRDDYVWRGVYDDVRFDRHVRSFIKKLIKMAKANDGFANTAHYQ
jgi:hypothetical protein